MGGRGTAIKHTLRWQIKSDEKHLAREFKTRGFIDGIKVISRDHGKTALPRIAATSDAYFAKNPQTGAIEQLRVYDKNRNPRFDIDIESQHKGEFSTHVHEWTNAHLEHAHRHEPVPLDKANVPARYRDAVARAIEENRKSAKP